MGGYTRGREDMETTIVIGLGEVGGPLYEIPKGLEHLYGLWI